MAVGRVWALCAVALALAGAAAGGVWVKGKVPREPSRQRVEAWERSRYGMHALISASRWVNRAWTNAADEAEKLRWRESNTSADVECAFCIVLVNEVEAMLAENITEMELMAYLTQVCPTLEIPSAVETCKQIVGAFPEIVAGIESKGDVSRTCVKLSMCAAPHEQDEPDPKPMPRFVLNLDLPPQKRWSQICSQPFVKTTLAWLVDTAQKVLGAEVVTGLKTLGESAMAGLFPPDFSLEITGCATAAGLAPGFVAAANMMYEVTDFCTSIVAQDPNGHIYHSRNLDFFAGLELTMMVRNLSMQVDFQSKGKTLYSAATFGGYVGIATGMRPGVFSVSVNTRFNPGGIPGYIQALKTAAEERRALNLVSFLVREALQNNATFADALNTLSNAPLVAPVYFTVGGVQPGEGHVITRNGTRAEDVWSLGENGTWFLAQTNYDHWKPVPAIDDRVDPANSGMIAMGQANLSLPNMEKVLSIKPVFNLQTVMTVMMSARDGSFAPVVRYCPFPCAE